MNILPFRLNFFKQTELFLMLRQLDKQYDLMIKKYDLCKERNKTLEEKASDGQISMAWPTWELEKKILRWTFENHKHLSSPITKEKIESNDFLADIGNIEGKTNSGSVLSESILIGSKYVIENLVIRGFADMPGTGKGCVINQEGLNIGSLIAKSYKFKKDHMLGEEIDYDKLVPKLNKRFGYQLLYWTAILLIIYSIFFLSLNIINMVGLLDQMKLFFSVLAPFNLYIILFLLIPVFTFILATLLIIFYKRK